MRIRCGDNHGSSSAIARNSDSAHDSDDSGKSERSYNVGSCSKLLDESQAQPRVLL